MYKYKYVIFAAVFLKYFNLYGQRVKNMNFDKMKKLLDSMAGKYYPGIDMCIYREHKEIFRYQAGYSDIENKKPVNPDSLYYLFSCTKPLTVVSAMQLAERGALLLSDPLKRYLPEFKDILVKEYAPNGVLSLVKPKRDIIIRDLFTMTAGFNYDVETEALKDAVKRTNGKCPTREMVKAMAQTPLEFHPGEKFRYSLCHDVLAAVIEVISGQKFGEYMRENIFEPCGMERSGFAVTKEIKDKMPPMYNYKGVGNFEKTRTYNHLIFEDESEYESGGAGLISCVDDYIKFADALANGGVAANGNRIISAKSIDLIRTPFVKSPVFTIEAKVKEGYDYGFGVRTFQHPEVGGQLSNIGEFGWDGAASSYVLIDPKEKLSVFCGEFFMNGEFHEAPSRYTNLLYAMLSDEKSL